MLKVHDIHTYYGASYILHGVSLEVERGATVALLGRNGMGKTTTVRSIMGLTPPQRGTITFNEKDITKLPPFQIARKGLALIPQGRRIFPSLTVRENLTLAMRGKGYDLDKIYSFFPILKDRGNNQGDQLSGGEQQMLAIARAMLANPELILMDEEIDLAFLKVKDYDPPYSFPLAEDHDITINQLVCAFEYSTTEIAGRKINFTPANRMGNVTRARNLNDIYGKSGEEMLELSFPALKGASGAPVVLNKTPFPLWGVVKSNVAREVMPAQIEKILDESGEITEETKFYLPQGLAIHVKHVRNMMKRIEG